MGGIKIKLFDMIIDGFQWIMKGLKLDLTFVTGFKKYNEVQKKKLKKRNAPKIGLFVLFFGNTRV